MICDGQSAVESTSLQVFPSKIRHYRRYGNRQFAASKGNVLRNIKKLGNLRKSARKCSPDDLFTFASDDVIPGKQTREQAIGVLSETLHYTTLQ